MPLLVASYHLWRRIDVAMWMIIICKPMSWICVLKTVKMQAVECMVFAGAGSVTFMGSVYIFSATRASNE